jgi:hypothetical protein
MITFKVIKVDFLNDVYFSVESYHDKDIHGLHMHQGIYYNLKSLAQSSS